MRNSSWRVVAGALSIVVVYSAIVAAIASQQRSEAKSARTNQKADSSKLNPAAWGDDHVGKPRPEFVTGDECLFCHRDIGKTWSQNRHQLTMRPADPASDALKALAASVSGKSVIKNVQYELGNANRIRFLKSNEQYGKLDLLTAQWSPPAARREGQLLHGETMIWDKELFAKSCAGCHTTAVDATTHAFAALSLDCYVCHGDVPLDHSKNAWLAHLSKQRKDDARVIVSICGQCHIRSGKSKTAGTPYPNNFVAGDNLFRDFQVDWSDESLKRLNPADRHVLENLRDVVVFGKSDVTCLSCHDVHNQSDKRHQTLAKSTSCTTCHDAANFKKLKRFEVHSEACGY